MGSRIPHRILGFYDPLSLLFSTVINGNVLVRHAQIEIHTIPPLSSSLDGAFTDKKFQRIDFLLVVEPILAIFVVIIIIRAVLPSSDSEKRHKYTQNQDYPCAFSFQEYHRITPKTGSSDGAHLGVFVNRCEGRKRKQQQHRQHPNPWTNMFPWRRRRMVCFVRDIHGFSPKDARRVGQSPAPKLPGLSFKNDFFHYHCTIG